MVLVSLHYNIDHLGKKFICYNLINQAIINSVFYDTKNGVKLNYAYSHHRTNTSAEKEMLKYLKVITPAYRRNVFRRLLIIKKILLTTCNAKV